jgi:hypothetical protein
MITDKLLLISWVALIISSISALILLIRLIKEIK